MHQNKLSQVDIKWRFAKADLKSETFWAWCPFGPAAAGWKLAKFAWNWAKVGRYEVKFCKVWPQIKGLPWFYQMSFGPFIKVILWRFERHFLAYLSAVFGLIWVLFVGLSERHFWVYPSTVSELIWAPFLNLFEHFGLIWVLFLGLFEHRFWTYLSAIFGLIWAPFLDLLERHFWAYSSVVFLLFWAPFLF